MGWILSLPGKVKTWAAIGFVFLLALIGAYFRGHSAGGAAIVAKHAAKERKDTATVTKVRTEVRAKSDDELNKEVDKWTRR